MAALDIGGSTVRVAEVEMGSGADARDGARLVAYAEAPVPAGVIRNGQIEEPSAFSEVLKGVFSAAKVGTKAVVVGVGDPSIVVREVEIPAQTADKTQSSLAFQVQDSLPMSVEDALLDFYPTAELEGSGGTMLRGLLVAAPRETVRSVLAALDKASVGVKRVDHTAFALWRSTLRGDLTPANIAVVDVGAETTTVVVSHQGHPRMVRVLPQGGQDATQAITTAYKGANVDAEALKLQIGMNQNVASEHRPVAEAATHAMSSLIDSIRNTLVYFASSNPGAAAQQVVLTGGGSYLTGFGQALSSATRLPVMIGSPLAGMAFGKRIEVEDLQAREPMLASVVGLAMGVDK